MPTGSCTEDAPPHPAYEQDNWLRQPPPPPPKKTLLFSTPTDQLLPQDGLPAVFRYMKYIYTISEDWGDLSFIGGGGDIHLLMRVGVRSIF